MPLHLLGKKSWNVYNPAAIERVRRDEAEAQRQAEEREKKALRDEADERVRLLRGGAPQPSDDSVKTIQVQSQDSAPRPAHRIQKRRLAGEDDTDCDIRIARERQVATTLSLKRQGPDEKEEDDSIVDSNGNISLIPVRHQHQQQLHNDSSGSAARKNSKIDEDPYTVYLSHAAGKDKDLATSKPWYYGGSSTGNDGLLTRAKWGDDSDRRRERESARIASQDPLAMMKRGVRQLREAEKQRQKWMEQRERDLREVEDLAVAAGPRRDKNRNMDDDGESQDRHHHHHHRRRRKRRDDNDGDGGGRDAEETISGRRRRRDKSKQRDDDSRDTTHKSKDVDEDSLDGFNLDEGYTNTTTTERRDRDRDRDRDRNRERSPNNDGNGDDKGGRLEDDRHHRRHDRHRHGHRHRSQRDDSPHHHHRHRRRSPDE